MSNEMPQPWQEFRALPGHLLGFTVYPDGTAAIRMDFPVTEAPSVEVMLDADTARDFAERLTRSLQYAGNGPFGPGKSWHPISGFETRG